ncbi:uncharacterized protein V1513DRAFT_447706 [Lipomyces chichibuensis]|uniref:uncharacterized protein n=1 Tax=Lipomyces chichibuensis TaxID=1546026 RepID=UPI003343793E
MSARRLIMRQKKGDALNDDEMRILEGYRLKERIRQRQLRVRKHKELSEAKATQQQDNDNRNVMDIVSILQELPFERRLQSDGRQTVDWAVRNRRNSAERQAEKADNPDDNMSGSSKEDKQLESLQGRSSVDDTTPKPIVQSEAIAGEDKKQKAEPNTNQDPLVPYTVLIPKSAIGAFYCVYCAFMAGHSIGPPPQGGEQQYFPNQRMFMAPPPPPMPSSFN